MVRSGALLIVPYRTLLLSCQYVWSSRLFNTKMPMRKLNLIALLISTFLIADKSPAAPPVPPYQATGYSLAFFEDFTNLNLSPDSQTGDYPWYRGLWYEIVPTPYNATLQQTGLDLAWTPGQTLPRTIISTCSQNGLLCRAFRYGYFEARMKWDVVEGAWPTFWLLPVQRIWGAQEFGELDVFEGQGETSFHESQTYYGTIHDWQVVNGIAVDSANNRTSNHVVIPGVDFSQLHTYGVLWVPGSVTWYLDDAPVMSYQTYPIFDEQNFYLMLGSQVGVKWQVGNTTGVTAPSLNLNVRWVRVWQK